MSQKDNLPLHVQKDLMASCSCSSGSSILCFFPTILPKEGKYNLQEASAIQEYLENVKSESLLHSPCIHLISLHWAEQSLHRFP